MAAPGGFCGEGGVAFDAFLAGHALFGQEDRMVATFDRRLAGDRRFHDRERVKG